LSGAWPRRHLVHRIAGVNGYRSRVEPARQLQAITLSNYQLRDIIESIV
jgi:hypothetical protein